jgi:putative IMPACT (imprinted ancient) family translation regulator
MRAYGGSAAHCLREAERVEMIEMVEATCECSFHDLARIRQRLDAAGAVIRTERYSALGVYIEVGLPKAQEPTVRLALGDISRGKAIFTTR